MEKVIRTTILVLFMCFQSAAYGQKGAVWSGVDTQLSKYGSEYKHVEVSYSLGYNFTEKFYAALKLEDSMLLVKREGDKDYGNNATLGLAAGYNIMKVEEAKLDIRAAVGSTLLNKDWKYLYYDGCLLLKRCYGRATPSVGFGLRYYDTYNNVYKNQLRFYVALGCSVVM